MRFRPCIDIHNGKVKQIVGGSLTEEGAQENFVSDHGAEYFAEMYRKDGLFGGHVILLNSRESEWYEETKKQAVSALRAFPGGLMAGGGMTPENAKNFLDAGASHVIVTSFVFTGGKLDRERLRSMKNAIGKERLVLDLSCRRKGSAYVVMTDRWQTFTSEEVSENLLAELAGSCAEFLVHAVDVEGKCRGIEEPLVEFLGKNSPIPVTYAGGIKSKQDLINIKEAGCNRVDATIGTALSLFGGELDYEEIKKEYN